MDKLKIGRAHSGTALRLAVCLLLISVAAAFPAAPQALASEQDDGIFMPWDAGVEPMPYGEPEPPAADEAPAVTPEMETAETARPPSRRPKFRTKYSSTPTKSASTNTRASP